MIKDLIGRYIRTQNVVKSTLSGLNVPPFAQTGYESVSEEMRGRLSFISGLCCEDPNSESYATFSFQDSFSKSLTLWFCREEIK